MSVILTGTGSDIPEITVSNEDVVNAMRVKSVEWIERWLRIKERKLFTPINEESGKPYDVIDEIAIAAKAGRRALCDAGLQPDDVDRLVYVTCTQDYPEYAHFSRAGMELLRSIGPSEGTAVTQMDAGCGGFVTVMNDTAKMLSGPTEDEVALIVASHVTSKFYDRDLYANKSDAWLTGYIFGDGAGAVVLEQEDTESGIIESYTTTLPKTKLIDFYYPENADKPVFKVLDSVKGTFGRLMKRGIDGLAQKQYQSQDPEDAREELLGNIDWLLSHQANKLLLDRLINDLEIDPSIAPANVHTHGNLSAATLPVLLSQTSSEIEEGDTILFAAVGAGTQLAATLISV